MMRSILYFVFILVVYYAVKAVVRSAVNTYAKKDERSSRLPGDEMVQDPECHTYILKDRAVTRRINNRLCSFCSEACAKQYEEKNRA
jgi:hypothetical protein